MKRCLVLVTLALALASCAHQRVGTQPHGELKQKCDEGSDTACHDYAFFTYDANPIWRSKYRNEALIDQLRTDSHSPARYRVLGPLANVPAFAQAFSCAADAPMMRAPAEQISIW